MKERTAYFSDKAIFLLTCCVYGTLAILLGTCNMRLGSYGHFNRKIAANVYPSDWRVFTSKKPQDTLYTLVRLQDGTQEPCNTRPFSAEFAYGIKRDNYIIAGELENIAKDAERTMMAKEALRQHPADSEALRQATAIDFRHYSSPNVHYLQGEYRLDITYLQNRHGFGDQRATTGKRASVTLNIAKR